MPESPGDCAHVHASRYELCGHVVSEIMKSNAIKAGLRTQATELA